MSDLLPVVGIDISKATFDAHWGSQKGKRWQARFSNDADGCLRLQAWIAQHGVSRVMVCLEATGTYSDAVATFCFVQGHHVSVLAPHKLHAFRLSEGILSKTDKIDAYVLACYGEQKRPGAWHPVSPAAAQLKRDLDRLDVLKAMRQQEQNRLESHRLDEQTRTHIQKHVDWLKTEEISWERQVHERFTQAFGQEQPDPEPEKDTSPISADPVSKGKKGSTQAPGQKKKRSRKPAMQIEPVDRMMQITGIGQLTALRMYAVLATMQEVRSAEQLASYFGVVPHSKESGTSVKGKARRRGGNAQARDWLYMAALSSKRWDPDMRQWAGELEARGLCKKAVIVAVMHKLVRILFALFTTAEPYDARKAFPSHSPIREEVAA